MKGVDYAWTHPSPSALSAAGIGFAMRYLSHDASKSLTKAERDALWKAGVGVGLVFEDAARRALGGFAAGAADARFAGDKAAAVGLPAAPIYFAVDTDITTQWATVGQYLRGAASVLGPGRTGVYCEYDLIEYCRKHGIPVAWYWQTTAWSRGKIHPAAHLFQQYPGARIGGVYVDRNVSLKPTFGVSFRPEPRPVPKPGPSPGPTPKPKPVRHSADWLRSRSGGWWLWAEWRLGIGRFKGWPPARPDLRPHVRRHIPRAWWSRLARFAKARQS